MQNVSFTVEKGDRVGILGLNGAGKSTLLKVIAGVFKPTEGSVTKHGKMVPLLELGAGFDQQYTGKENIYLYGAMLGYSKEFIDEKYDEIVKFSELKDFIDVPIKNYSSGMKSRLGFSIATVVSPKILILDRLPAVRLWGRGWGGWSAPAGSQRWCQSRGPAPLGPGSEYSNFLAHSRNRWSGEYEAPSPDRPGTSPGPPAGCEDGPAWKNHLGPIMGEPRAAHLLLREYPLKLIEVICMEGKQTKRICLSLTEDCYRELKELAQKNSYSLPGYVRQLVRVHLRELEKKNEL